MVCYQYRLKLSLLHSIVSILYNYNHIMFLCWISTYPSLYNVFFFANCRLNVITSTPPLADLHVIFSIDSHSIWPNTLNDLKYDQRIQTIQPFAHWLMIYSSIINIPSRIKPVSSGWYAVMVTIQMLFLNCPVSMIASGHTGIIWNTCINY